MTRTDHMKNPRWVHHIVILPAVTPQGIIPYSPVLYISLILIYFPLHSEKAGNPNGYR